MKKAGGPHMKLITADIGNIVNWDTIKTKYSARPTIDNLHDIGKELNQKGGIRSSVATLKETNKNSNNEIGKSALSTRPQS